MSEANASTEGRPQWRRHDRLSRYYASKSRSFSQLSDALKTEYGDSALALGKRRPASSELEELAIYKLRQLTLNGIADDGKKKDVWCPIRRVRRKMQAVTQRRRSIDVETADVLERQV